MLERLKCFDSCPFKDASGKRLCTDLEKHLDAACIDKIKKQVVCPLDRKIKILESDRMNLDSESGEKGRWKKILIEENGRTVAVIEDGTLSIDFKYSIFSQ